MRPKEIFDLFGEIKYGWVDKSNQKHYVVDNTYSNNYKLQSPEEVTVNKLGVCWDQVELERALFSDNGLAVKTYFIVHYDNDKCPTHTFLTYKNNNNIYWFEHSWFKYKGIHEYKSLKELLVDVRNKFIVDQLDGNFNQNNLCVFEYLKPKYGISATDFCKHCENGENIDVDKLLNL
jgi:hypothetical protein